MLRTIKRVWQDILHGKNIDAYVATVFALFAAMMSVLDEIVPTNLQMAALLTGLALLIFRLTDPDDETVDLDRVLLDRESYGSLREFVGEARDLRIYGASAVNVLRNTDIIRDVLNRPNGRVQVLLQDPQAAPVMDVLYQQLDKDHDLRTDIDTSLSILENLQSREEGKRLEYGFVPYSPGFSCIVVNPDARDGRLVVEFYGYQNDSISSRMHIEVYRNQTIYWFEYWQSQFDLMWESRRQP